MKKKQFNFGKTITKKINLKFRILITLLFILISTLTICEYVNYKASFKDFSSNFDQNKFSNANNILLTRETLNPFKSFLLKNDLKKYFYNKLNTLPMKLKLEI